MIDNYVDLSEATYTAAGANSDRITIKTEWQCRINGVDRDEVAIYKHDYGAGGITFASPHYFTLKVDRRDGVASSWAACHLVSNTDPGTTKDSYWHHNNLAGLEGVCIIASAQSATSSSIRIYAWSDGAEATSDLTSLTASYTNFPLYCVLSRSGDVYTLTVYDQPHYVADHVIFTLTCTSVGSSADTYRYHQAVTSYNSGAGSYSMSLQYGNLYWGGNTPPEKFYILDNPPFLIDPDDYETFENASWPAAGDEAWTEYEPDGAGATIEYEADPYEGSGSAHIALVEDTTRAGAYFSCSVTTLDAGEVVCYAKLNSLNDGNKVQIIGLWEATPQYIVAEIYRSGANYYWRLSKYEGAAYTAGTQTRFTCTPGTWYQIVLTIVPNDTEETAILYVDGVPVECVEKAKFAPSRVYIGFMAGVTAANSGGDINVDSVKYRNGCAMFPSIHCYNGTTLVSYRVDELHGTGFGVNYIDVFKSTGGAYSKLLTLGPTANTSYGFSFVRYNTVTASWWLYVMAYIGSDNTEAASYAYEITNIVTGANSLRASFDSAPSKFRIHPMHWEAAGGKVPCVAIYHDSDDIAGTNTADYFLFDAAGDYSIDSQVEIAAYGDYAADYKLDEGSLWHDGDGHLHVALRCQPEPEVAANGRLWVHEESTDDGGTWADDPVAISEPLHGHVGKPQLYEFGSDELIGQGYDCRNTLEYKSFLIRLDTETLNVIQEIHLLAGTKTEASYEVGNGDAFVSNDANSTYAYLVTDVGTGAFVYTLLMNEIAAGKGGGNASKLMMAGML